MNYILFYEPEEKYGFCSNFYKTKPLKINGKLWQTTEAFFQAMKYDSLESEESREYMELIRIADSPAKVKMLGTQKKNTFRGKTWKLNKSLDHRLVNDLIDKYKNLKIRSDWENVKVKVMVSALLAKFSDSDLRKKLLDIPDNTYLVEHTTRDSIWGDGGDGGNGEKGSNFLGKILTALSHYYKHKSCANMSPELKKKIQINNIPVNLPKIKMTQAITLTFGDMAENHAGMQIIGKEVTSGFSKKDILKMKDVFEAKGITCELLSLHENIDEQVSPAYVLIIRNGVSIFCDPDKLYTEQSNLDADKRAWMRGRVVNKNARHNLCFDEKAQEPDYEKKKGRIVAYSEVPFLSKIKNNMETYFGEKAKDLVVEGNYYYNPSICGIGFHGDSERKRVIAVRLGVSIPLHYQWFYQSKPIGKRIIINLNHGDIYVMSEKAVGFDWKRSSQYTLRHAAGCAKFTTIK